MLDDKVKVEWVTIKGKEFLKFQFQKNLSEDAAMDAISEWRKAFDERSGQTISIIWGAQEMRAYHSRARMRWTKAMKELKPQIGTVWLITNSNVVAMGASLMGTVTGLDIKTAKDEAKISV